MKRFAIFLAAAAALAAPLALPAAGQSAARTQLVADGGKQVDSLLLRYGFDAMWQIDKSNIVLRDTYRDHYLVTTAKPCEFLQHQHGVTFVPALTSRIRSDISYEVRDEHQQICDIAKVEKIPQDEAKAKIASITKD